MSLPPEAIASYRSQGYAIARGVMDMAEVAALRAAADELLLQARGKNADFFVGVTFFNILRRADPFAQGADQAEVVPDSLRRVTYPYALSAVLDQHRQSPKLLSLVAALLGPDIKQIVNQVNYNPAGLGTGWGWHQDYAFRKPGIHDLGQNFVQSIIALDICDSVTGGLRLIPGSSGLGPLRLDKYPETAASHFDAKDAITPVLQPGDVLLFGPYVVHGSTPNRSAGPRRVYINGYVRASACPSHGQLVWKDGARPRVPAQGQVMEYEGDQAILPLAAKY